MALGTLLCLVHEQFSNNGMTACITDDAETKILDCTLMCLCFISQAAKDVVLAEKPVISDDSNQLEPSLLDELLANIATLSSVYHKPPEAFVTRVKATAQRTEDDDYPEGSETGYSETLSHAVDGVASPPTTSSNVPYSTARQPAPAPAPAPAPVPDLLGDLIGLDNSAIVPIDQPVTPTG